MYIENGAENSGQCEIFTNDKFEELAKKTAEIEGIKEIGEQKNTIADVYYSIYVATSMILSKTSQENEGMAVDIRAVVKYFGLDIVESEMHSNRNFFKNEVMGFIDIYAGKNGGTIYINQNLGDLSKRYAIAHEFAHYYFDYFDKSNVNSGGSVKNCIKMLFPKTAMEQLCDIMAAFLLMPIKRVLKLMSGYLEVKSAEGACPVYAEDCLRYLGHELKISDFHVALCYQHVLYLGGILREKKGNLADLTSRGIFTEMDEYKKILC